MDLFRALGAFKTARFALQSLIWLIVEIAIWTAIASLVVLKPFLAYDSVVRQRTFFPNEIQFTVTRDQAFADLALAAAVSGLILLIPILSRAIFGISPLSWILQNSSDLLKAATRSTQSVPPAPAAPEAAEPLASGQAEARYVIASVAMNNPRELLNRYAKESAILADRVYTRAGVYLMVGVFISIGGLGFFYARGISLGQDADLLTRALSLLPGFGILFFIEFVALFFLRQHRAAMDDFRYFNSVRRHREENLVLLNMFAENSDIVPTADVIKAMTFYSGNQKLAQGETTEILEARRLQRDDIVVFEKLVEAFGALKAAAASATDKKKE